MEPADSVLARLDRIGALDRSGAAPGELLEELRELLLKAEALPRDGRNAEHDAVNETVHDTGHNTGEVVGRLRAALARDIIG